VPGEVPHTPARRWLSRVLALGSPHEAPRLPQAVQDAAPLLGPCGPRSLGRNRCHEDAFEQFRATVNLDDVLAVAKDVLAAAVPTCFRDETLARLARRRLTESQKKLLFNYKIAFERVVASRSTAIRRAERPQPR
jgi:hypothetical protein